MTTVTLRTRNGKKEVEVPKYFALQGYSDAYPYEVVEAVSDKTVVVRSMKSTLDPTWKPEMHVGGFAAHCSNQRSQRWIHESDENGSTITIRRKRKPKTRKRYSKETMTWEEVTEYEWTHKGTRFVTTDKPYKFHDYNF